MRRCDPDCWACLTWVTWPLGQIQALYINHSYWSLLGFLLRCHYSWYILYKLAAWNLLLLFLGSCSGFWTWLPFFGDVYVLCLSILVRFLQISRNLTMSTCLSIYEGQIQMRWIAQLKLKEIYSFSASLFYSGTSWIGWYLLAFMKTIFFSQSTHVMLLSSWNTLIDTSRNKVLIAISASLSSVKLTHKINLCFK